MDSSPDSATIYVRWGKRVMDLAVAVPTSLLLLPAHLVLWAVVRARLGSPVVFRQLRPGKDHLPFVMLKYRTMTDQRDEAGQLLPDGERLTRLGRFLRSTSLDELPELYNVIKGDMSLVGPRPLLMSYLDRYTPRQARRHEVRPGITGWAQVNGRNRITWEEKFEQDVYYIDNVSLRLDFRILWMTAVGLFRRGDINADGHATAPEFLGSLTVND